MSRSAVFAVALAAVAVAVVAALPAENATVSAKQKLTPDAAPGPAVVASLEPPPRPGHIMVRPPPRQVEEASAAPVPVPGAVPAPLTLPVRPANLGPAPRPGTISFPNERPLQQADERLDADQQDVWSWESLRDGCGYTKNCLGFPDGCESDGTQCSAIVTVQLLKQTDAQASADPEYTFRMRATDAKWVAVGLGETPRMYDTSVIECVTNTAGGIDTHLSYTPSDTRDCRRLAGASNAIRLIQSRNMDGGLFCEVTRINRTRYQNIDWFLDEKAFYVQLAMGNKLKEDNAGGGLGYHGSTRVATAQVAQLYSYRPLSAASNWPMRLHGALMVLAWMCAATTGLLAARYFKAAWGKATICGKAMWFAWHRLLMALTLVLHIAAVTAALIFLEGWSSSSGVHGILGGITTGLALLQGLAGFLRPDPDHKYRPIFNWGHRAQGFITHVIAVITIFFAVSLPNARLPSAWTYAILSVYVVFYLGLHGLHSLTEVKSYYFLIVFFGSAIFAIIMLILIVIGPGSST